MKLILLYGPPAVGKLTIATLLKEKTHYKLLHNHLLQNPVSEVFSFDNPANTLLVREFRLRILSHATDSNIDLIATFGIFSNNPFSHIEQIIKTVEEKGGTVCLVQLKADKQILLERVEMQSRKDHGKTLSKEDFQSFLEKNNHLNEAYEKANHLTIDTGILTPEESLEKIRSYYHL